MSVEMDLGEFRDTGFLQEANRQFFHPVGLALSLVFDEDGIARHLIVLKDDDPEGWRYEAGVMTWEKYASVKQIFANRFGKRMEAVGYFIQPPPTMSS